MEIKVCMGSACHIKGSPNIARKLQALLKENGLDEKVGLRGSFCMGPCNKGVVVTVNGKAFYHISEDNVEKFFYKEIFKRGEEN